MNPPEIPDGRWRPEAEGPGYSPVRYLRRGAIVVRQVMAGADGLKLVFPQKPVAKATCERANMQAAR